LLTNSRNYDGLAVGYEVGVARAPARRSEHEPLDGVVDVGRGGAVASAADPGEAAAADQLDHRRQQGRVAHPPHEAGAHDHRLEALAVGRQHGLLGARLGGAVESGRVRPQRGALVDVQERPAREQRCLGADVDEPPHARVGARPQHVGGALDVAALEQLGRAPVAERGRGVKRELAAVGTGTHGGDVGEIALHRLGAAGADPLGRPARARQGAHGVTVEEQPLDQSAADEARPTGDERFAHAPRRLDQTRGGACMLRACRVHATCGQVRFASDS
jgi:hypothetical protein